MVSVIKPNWPAPTNVHAYTTMRQGGYSQASFAGLNLSTAVDDDDKAVARNRELLQTKLELPKTPIWLQQTHATTVVDLGKSRRKHPIADASFSRRKNVVCGVLTADCLPILLCNHQGNCVAAIHAGWRGLAAGIIEATLDTLKLSAEETLAWLGPAIGATAFEVGSEVYSAFIDQDPQTEAAFKPLTKDKWLADIYHLARLKLAQNDVTHIYGGDYCTYTESDKFYSYRRDGANTGRMASLIWFT